MPARTRLRYGCSTPTAVSVGSPQLHTAHARAAWGRIVATAASNIAAAARRLRTAVSRFFRRVAVICRRIVGHRLTDVALGGAAVGRAVGAALVARAGRDHAGAGAHRSCRAVGVAVAVAFAVTVGMIEIAEVGAGAALPRGATGRADGLILLVAVVVVAARDE